MINRRPHISLGTLPEFLRIVSEAQELELRRGNYVIFCTATLNGTAYGFAAMPVETGAIKSAWKAAIE